MSILTMFADQAGRSFGDADFASLPSHLRMMLVADGALGPLLAAHHLEPVTTHCVTQTSLQLAGAQSRWLLAADGQFATRREVVLSGSVTTRAYVLAVSLLLDERLPDSFWSLLSAGDGNIGRAISVAGMETRRQLLWCGLDLAGGLVRSYRIFHKRLPAILIEENFLRDQGTG